MRKILPFVGITLSLMVTSGNISNANEIVRYSGANRYETSIKTAKKVNSTTLVFASGENSRFTKCH